MTTEAERLAELMYEKPDSDGHCIEASKLIRSQAAEIERLKSTPPAQREDLHCVIADLTRQCQESDALLRQAVEALESIDVGYRSSTGGVHEVSFNETDCNAAITAIKQHLGEV